MKTHVYSPILLSEMDFPKNTKKHPSFLPSTQMFFKNPTTLLPSSSPQKTLYYGKHKWSHISKATNYTVMLMPHLQKPPSSFNDQPNLEFTKWVLIDQLFFSALNSLLFDFVLALLFDCETSNEVWMKFEGIFLTQFCAHLMHTQHQIAILKKGVESITKYYNKVNYYSQCRMEDTYSI